MFLLNFCSYSRKMLFVIQVFFEFLQVIGRFFFLRKDFGLRFFLIINSFFLFVFVMLIYINVVILFFVFLFLKFKVLFGRVLQQIFVSFALQTLFSVYFCSSSGKILVVQCLVVCESVFFIFLCNFLCFTLFRCFYLYSYLVVGLKFFICMVVVSDVVFF